MVKGVNKTVIEVNDTGSKIFEKVVFYVSPKYSSLTAKQLRKAAQSLNINRDEVIGNFKPLRQKWFRKKVFTVSVSSFFVSLILVGVYFLFIK